MTALDVATLEDYSESEGTGELTMAAITYDSRSKGYGKQWDSAEFEDVGKRAQADKIADQIIAHRATYEDIEKDSNVPWFWQGPVHQRESSLNFKTHLHCGDPLTARTYHEPKGRPAAGSPPFTFKESALDALTAPPHSLRNVKRWSVERMLYEQERYNGFGYVKHATNSPYVWGWSTEQEPGKYVADGVWDPNAWDKQPGTAVIMKALAAKCPDVAKRLADREANPPAEVLSDQSKRERRTTGAGAGTAAGGGATASGTEKKTDEFSFAPIVGYTVLGVGLAVALVAAFLWARKINFIKSKWGV